MTSNGNENKINDVFTDIEYKGNTYQAVFNINVMESLQEEYGSFDNWVELIKPKDKNKEADIKALKFVFKEMINEGIDIMNEDNGTDMPLFTDKQIGRIITDIGLDKAGTKVMETVVKSTKSTEKN